MENLKKDINELNIREKVVQDLKQNNINNIFELCKLSRIELSALGLKNSAINEIMISLQLLGLNLKPNHAKKNSLTEK